jgi:hypothetical protein
MAIFFFFTLI